MTTFSDNQGGDQTNVAALADVFAQFHNFSTWDAAKLGDAPFAVVPEGKEIKSLKSVLDEFRLLPDRRRGTARLSDAESFIALVDRFKGDNSAIFADPKRDAPKLTAVFDWHPKGGDATKADWLRHQAVYAPPLSEEWKAWTAGDGKSMNQGDFAAFVETHIGDLIAPFLDDPRLKTFADLVGGVWASPADMMSLSRGLQVNVESTVKNHQTLSTGEVSIIYDEVHKDGAGQPLKIPTLFTICIPVFYLGDLYRIAARLRYRVQNARVVWSYQLVRTDLVFDDAFKGIVAKVRKETGLAVLLGTAEA